MSKYNSQQKIHILTKETQHPFLPTTTPSEQLPIPPSNLIATFIDKRYLNPAYTLAKTNCKHINDATRLRVSQNSINNRENSLIPCQECQQPIKYYTILKKYRVNKKETKHYGSLQVVQFFVGDLLKDGSCLNCGKNCFDNNDYFGLCDNCLLDQYDYIEPENVDIEYKCPVCNKNFASLQSKDRHFSSMHNKEYEHAIEKKYKTQYQIFEEQSTSRSSGFLSNNNQTLRNIIPSNNIQANSNTTINNNQPVLNQINQNHVNQQQDMSNTPPPLQQRDSEKLIDEMQGNLNLDSKRNSEDLDELISEIKNKNLLANSHEFNKNYINGKMLVLKLKPEQKMHVLELYMDQYQQQLQNQYLQNTAILKAQIVKQQQNNSGFFSNLQQNEQQRPLLKRQSSTIFDDNNNQENENREVVVQQQENNLSDEEENKKQE